MRRGQPTRPRRASTLVLRVECARPLRKTLFSKSNVILTTGLRKPRQIPAAKVRAPHHNDVYTLPRPKTQLLRGPEHAILVLGFNHSHNLIVSRALENNDDAQHTIKQLHERNQEQEDYRYMRHPSQGIRPLRHARTNYPFICYNKIRLI
jgi:hypothetical protein